MRLNQTEEGCKDGREREGWWGGGTQRDREESRGIT